MNVALTAVAGKLRGIFLDAEINMKIEGGKTRAVKMEKSTSPVHDDLRAQFVQLVPHFAFICEEIPKDADLELAIEDYTQITESYALFGVLANYTVTAYKITNEGNADKEGVVLTGTKTLSTKETITIEAPVVKWSDNYEFLPYLQETITKLREETELYWDGKEAPDRQGNLFDQGGASPAAAGHVYKPGQDADFDNLPPAGDGDKKRRGRKKKDEAAQD